MIETLEKRYEISSKITTKTPERRQRRRSGVFINYFTPFSGVSVVDFEQVIVSWVKLSGESRNNSVQRLT